MISAIFLNLFLILHLLKQVFKLVLMKKTRNKFIPIKLQSSWQSNVYLKEYEKKQRLILLHKLMLYFYLLCTKTKDKYKYKAISIKIHTNHK